VVAKKKLVLYWLVASVWMRVDWKASKTVVWMDDKSVMLKVGKFVLHCWVEEKGVEK
jgi:hypothetical protein